VSPHVPVVSSLCLLKEVDVFVKQLLRRERNSINSLKTVVRGLAQPIGRGVLENFEGLHSARVRNVRTRAKVDEVPAAVGRDLPAFWDLVLNEGDLERVVAE